jgi:hypothetical protein
MPQGQLILRCLHHQGVLLGGGQDPCHSIHHQLVGNLKFIGNKKLFFFFFYLIKKWFHWSLDLTRCFCGNAHICFLIQVEEFFALSKNLDANEFALMIAGWNPFQSKNWSLIQRSLKVTSLVARASRGRGTQHLRRNRGARVLIVCHANVTRKMCVRCASCSPRIMQILRAPAARGARNKGCYYWTLAARERMSTFARNQWKSSIIMR